MVLLERTQPTKREERLQTVQIAQNVNRPNVMVDLGTVYNQLVVEIAAQVQARLLFTLREQWNETVLLMQELEEKRQRARFQELAQRWRAETGHLSVTYYAFDHPAYLSILHEAGPYTVKFMLEELRDNNGPWFEALDQLTEQEITAPAGNLKALRNSWLRWGKSQGQI